MSYFTSFNPAIKKHSRPVFDPVQGKHLPPWAWALAFVLVIAFIATTYCFEQCVK